MRNTIAALIMLLACAVQSRGQAPATQQSAPAKAPLLLGEDDKPVAGVLLSKVDVHVVIHGTLAEATMTLTFANSQPRVLGGNLVFPLPEGATVTGYGLDINGVMVDGVAVEKERARVIYEQEVHKRVDPGLVEHVVGNAFRTRLYPIPPNGARSIKIQYVTQAGQDKDGAALTLPMGFADGLDELMVRLEAPEAAVAPLVRDGMEGLAFAKAERGFAATASIKNVKTREQMIVTLPQLPTTSVAIEKRLKIPRTIEDLDSGKGGAPAARPDQFENYFLATDVPVVPARQAVQLKNKRIGVIWDASLSRSDADHARELRLLEAVLARLGHPIADLVVVRNDVEVHPGPFGSAEGTAKLIDLIKGLPYDGATNLGALLLPKNVSDYPGIGARGLTADYDLFLLFTDGVGNLGPDKPLRAEAPVYAICDNLRANHPLLRTICQESGGSYFNLKQVTDDQVLAGVGDAPFSVVSIDCKPEEIAEVYPPMGAAIDGRLSLSGKLLVPQAKLTVNYGYGKQVTSSHTFTIDATGAPGGSLLPRFWAQQKVAALSLLPEKNADEISRLGKQFNLVTPNTSLVVLETVDQYVQYRVVPPLTRPDIYNVFLAQIEQHKAQAAQTREQKLQQVAAIWTQRVQWWEQEHRYPSNLRVSPEGDGPQGPVLGNGGGGDAAPSTQPAQALAQGHVARPPAESGPERRVSGSRGSRQARASTPAPSAVSGRLHQEAARVPDFTDAPDFSLNSTGNLAHIGEQEKLTKATAGTDRATSELSVVIKSWDPGTPYIAAMKAVAPEKAYDVYLQQRREYAHSPAFYFDCADYLVSVNQQALGVRVLSDIVELDLQDARLLRVAAHRLNQIGQRELAIDLFEKVLKLRPEEPQSYRDLALSLADRADATVDIANHANQQRTDQALGDYVRSLELLNKVVLGDWPRFLEIELPVLMEANDIAAKAQRLPGVHDFHNPLDSRLRKNLDLDVRVVMTWDADQTDIDLWVTEPSGEKCFYGHNRTAIGGLLSRDFTDGYGPEEYCLRKLMPGTFVIQSNFYGSRQQELTGPATVQATVITDFGRPNEKRRALTLRLKEVKQVFDIGSITLGKVDPAAPAQANK